ncbi:Lrp/AsnC family leucine-responsive transcriptional regulator [Kutzneria buriramensis]|uniref:Lrp/AsnC family leucine-responsive transcriptional regulator n=1 Tax=Kutzneria buriramensis TaxID=1045776 RepID=A0A3E0HEK0_9PSEU|nr:Lrp/AsnC family leucine-responsive transcriptional regulator [Kutzneria buriramensis]
MDAVDREILTVLLHDGRITYQELGRAVRLSANAVADRVRRLRKSGIVRGYRADLDFAALGRPLVLVTDVRLRDGVSGAEFERGLRGFPQIFSAAHVTGEYDYQLRMACTDTVDFEELIERLKRDHGARELRSRLVLRQIALDPAGVLEIT